MLDWIVQRVDLKLGEAGKVPVVGQQMGNSMLKTDGGDLGIESKVAARIGRSELV